jgi:UDP-N-acetylglucosamine transferase subunit ALG13
MIFVTVGTQLPFDRLIAAVDEWAQRANRNDVFAQIGESTLFPAALEWVRFLDPEETEQYIRGADVIIAHAGIGTIIAALEHNKPLLVLPRLKALGEQRTDHQVATARRFGELGLVKAAENTDELKRMLDELDRVSVSAATMDLSARQEFTDFLYGFLRGA